MLALLTKNRGNTDSKYAHIEFKILKIKLELPHTAIKIVDWAHI
jgi:hypothetical protein